MGSCGYMPTIDFNPMLVSAEVYKGIEFVRISSLPPEQKKEITNSFNINLFINILKDDIVLRDCLQYKHYVLWYETIFDLNEELVEADSSIKMAS